MLLEMSYTFAEKASEREKMPFQGAAICKAIAAAGDRNILGNPALSPVVVFGIRKRSHAKETIV